MRHQERVDDQKRPLFPKMRVNDRSQTGGGGTKPPPRNKMAAAGSTNVSQRINTWTTALPMNMPPPPSLMPPPKFCSSGSSIGYVGDQVPPSASVRFPFYAQNTATIDTSTFPTLPLLPLSDLGDGQVASVSQHQKPLQVPTARNIEKRHPELEIFKQNHFRYDTNRSKGYTADDSVARTDASTTNLQQKQSNHSSIVFGSGSSSTKYSVDQIWDSELIKRDSCLPKAPVDDIRGLAGVATSSNTPDKHCGYRVPASQTATNRKGSHPETTPGESTSTAIRLEITAIIGEDAFLRLRSEMIKHQKQFVEQVFELHRVIAVQKLIARSRRTLVGDKYKLDRPSSKRTMNPKETQKGHRVESQDDTLRLKTSSGYQNDMFYLPLPRKDLFRVPPITPRPNQETSAGTPKPVIRSGINSPWIYPSPGTTNHWLVPIVSPSEGLIYKPYPIPSAPSPTGFIPPPIPINPPKPAQTHPPPFQQSGIRPLADFPFCFPPYAAPTSPFEHTGNSESCHHPKSALPGSSLKSSWNLSNLGNGSVSCQVETAQQAKYYGDSTASSSPPDKIQRNILPLFPEEPTAIAMLNKPPHHQSSEQNQRKVIKVVPHPPSSATESTARIIRSIWEERN